ncbi:MAG: TIGR03618 family F420-dependent PPOX class oxidoreductase [Jatrophihabitans sp.]|nr:MAG: TIGR03618 family F420-dependent PPOX class oxidoreductase [Jatrophihabitans sp.]
MRKNLEVADLGDLVELPLAAVLATYRSDGTVLLSPVWHEYRDGGFTVVVYEDDIKARHLRRDPRAVLVVAEALPPFRGVEVSGTVHLRSDGVRDAIERIAVRYLGAQRGRAYAEATGGGVIVRLEPGRLRAWDFQDDMAAFDG